MANGVPVDRAQRRAHPETQHGPHNGVLIAGAALGAGGLLWWLLHHKSAGSFPEPIPCPTGWSGSTMPDCTPPPCAPPPGIPASTWCPPAFSQPDLELALARIFLKSTAAEGYGLNAVHELVGLMNQPAPSPEGQVGYTRTLDALESVLSERGLAQRAGQ